MMHELFAACRDVLPGAICLVALFVLPVLLVKD